MKKILLILLMCTLANVSNAQSLNENWEEEVTNSLYEFMACDDPLDDISPCNKFVGEALKMVYGIHDFYDEEKERYLLANEIADFLAKEDKWTLLGKGSEQSALNEAQGYANLGKAVVAVLKSNSGHGHVAIILPGESGPSSAWGLNVPNSASFFIYKPESSYIGKKLSYAFKSKNKGNVLLYGRNY